MPRILVDVPICAATGIFRWKTIAKQSTSTGTAVFILELDGTTDRIVLRIGPRGASGLTRETAILQKLSGLPRRLRELLPTRLLAGHIDGHSFSVDGALPGSQPTGSDPARDLAALTLIGELHRATAHEVTIQQETLQAWVNAPLQRLGALLRRSRMPLPRDAVIRLKARMENELAGKSVQVSWIHGDFWAGNLLVDRASNLITGIVDWDLAAFPELPIHDVLHPLLVSEAQSRRQSLGQVIIRLVRDGHWTAQERSLLETAAWAFPQDVNQSTLVLLYWLRYVAAIAQQQDHYVNHSALVWRLLNVHNVLRKL
jgi:Ser/Thr protein kinase RdoA (MazF antagonist)